MNTQSSASRPGLITFIAAILTVLFAVDAFADGGFQINEGLNDAWKNPNTGGQGFFVTVLPDANILFLAWFTYELERPGGEVGANLGDPGHRWLTAFGHYAGDTAELEIEITQGGLFDTSPPVPNQNLDGTITLRFTDCSNGEIDYDIPSVERSGKIPIKRIAPDNVPLCEELAVAAQ